MSDILSGVQSFIIAVFAVVITAISAISPFDKPQPTPTPPAQIQQETQEQGAATQSSNVLGTIEDSDAKEKVQPKLSKNPSPTPTPSAPAASDQRVNPTLNYYQWPAYTTPQYGKSDYSSYKSALQATLGSLRNRLSSVQSQADQVPQEVNSQINSINSRLESDLLSLETSYNQSTTNLSREFGQRGIPLSSQLFQDQLNALTESYNNSRNSLISQAEQEKQQVYANAKNKIYQADTQDKDLSNKIAIVESLINKISSGGFTDSDIPLAVQAMYY